MNAESQASISLFKVCLFEENLVDDALLVGAFQVCRLSWLKMSHNKLKSISSVADAIAANRTIRYLNLSYNQLQNSGIDFAKILASSTTNIRKLSVKVDRERAL